MMKCMEMILVCLLKQELSLSDWNLCGDEGKWAVWVPSARPLGYPSFGGRLCNTITHSPYNCPTKKTQFLLRSEYTPHWNHFHIGPAALLEYLYEVILSKT